MKLAASLVALACTGLQAAPLLAQNLCEGNGVGSAYIRATPAVIGGSVRIDIGSTTAPGSFGFLSFSGGLGPTTSPFAGPMCFDINSPIYTALFYLLDGSGNAALQSSIPNSIGAYGFAPLYVNAFISEGGNFGLSKTARLQWELPDQFRPVPADAAVPGRSMHTTTALFDDDLDNRQDIFIAGGASGTIITPTALPDTYIWEPLTRSFEPGPLMSLPRTLHAAVRLRDGRVLLTGGATTSNVGTASCDIYDPNTRTITPAASMSTPRMGHAISLLDDGRVVVSGGFSDWQNASSQFAARLQTAQDTMELYDPLTNTWSAGPTMANPRAGHTQTRLPGGGFLIVGGVAGGQSIQTGLQVVQVPVMSATCQVYNPITNVLINTAPIPVGAANIGRGFHAASSLPNGNVLVTGGAAPGGQYSEAICQNDCQIYDINTNSWSATAPLGQGVAFHRHAMDRATGDVLVSGGFTASFGFSPSSKQVGFHDGTTWTAMAEMGSNDQEGTPNLAGRAGHGVLQTQDGAFWIWGGQDTSLVATTWADGYVYVR